MKNKYGLLAAIFFILTVILAVAPARASTMVVMRFCSLPTAALAVGFIVAGLQAGRSRQDTFTYEECCAPARLMPLGTVPPAPQMPAGVAPEELALGSLRGAENALPRFAPAFAQDPMLCWQFQRICQVLGDIGSRAQQPEQTTKAVAFAVNYLPSVMQYLAACTAEGCPSNAVDTLVGIALACEKQQDAMDETAPAGFENEVRALRTALQNAAFTWNHTAL